MAFWNRPPVSGKAEVNGAREMDRGGDLRVGVANKPKLLASVSWVTAQGMWGRHSFPGELSPTWVWHRTVAMWRGSL